MAFLEKPDYASQIKADLLEVVINQDDTIRTKAELAARAEMESYLRVRYDVAQIFAVSGEGRHPQLLMYLIDITLYHLHSRINPRNISEIREVRYNQAVDWLKAVSQGKIAPDLPALATDQPSNRTTYGSWTKNQNYL